MSKLVPIKLFSLAFRQLLRDIKAGELRILFFALMITVTCSTAIGYFSARLQASMEAKAGDFLAADRSNLPNAVKVAEVSRAP